MGGLDALGRRLSYANVTATVALFVALDGASYAAMRLPEHSVGSRQLQRGAVGVSALGFPIGAKGLTDDKRQTLAKLEGCNAPLSPNAPPGAEVHCPLLLPYPVGPGRALTFHMTRPGEVLISSVVALQNPGPVGTSAEISAGALLDGAPVSSSNVTLPGRSQTTVPIERVVAAAAGKHLVKVWVDGRYNDYAGGQVVDSPVTVSVTVLPGF
jgi:hypothetical protein